MIGAMLHVLLIAVSVSAGLRDLQVTLSAGTGDDVAEIVAGDPVLLTMTVSNDGDVPISLIVPEVGRRARGSSGSTVHFKVARPGEAYRIARPISLLHAGYGPVAGQWQIETLQPGDSRQFVLLPSWWYWEGRRFLHSAEWAFPEPGEYQIEATILVLTRARVDEARVPRDNVKTRVVTSDPLTIRVVSPATEQDRKASEELVTLKSAWRFYEPWYNHGLPEELLAFRERHAGSRYIQFIEMADLYHEFAKAQSVQDKERMLEILEHCEALVASAKGEPWPAGWIATAEQLRLIMWKGAQVSTPRPPPITGEALRPPGAS